MTESIFSAPVRREAPRPCAGQLHASSTIASSDDAALLAILEAPRHAGEPAALGFLRKEAELRAAFAALPVSAARALHARLANPRHGDLLAARFSGLVADRRARLLAFLGDARRREALAAAASARRGAR